MKGKSKKVKGKSKTIFPFFLLPFAFCLQIAAGCATGGDVKRLRAESLYIQGQLDDLGQRMADLDSLIREQGEIQQRLKADLKAEMEVLSERVAVLDAKVVENGSRIARLAQKVESAQLYGARRPRPPATEGDTARARSGVDPQLLYEQALADMNKGSYQAAVAELSLYLSAFPNERLIDNAQYWLGVCYYALKDFQRALTELQKVMEKYPESDKVPAAMLKIGDALAEMKDLDGAIKGLQELIERFPDSGEAALARERVKALEEAKPKPKPKGPPPRKKR